MVVDQRNSYRVFTYTLTRTLLDFGTKSNYRQTDYKLPVTLATESVQ